MVKTVLPAIKKASVAADLTWHVHIVRLAGAAATKIDLLLAGATLPGSFPQRGQILGGTDKEPPGISAKTTLLHLFEEAEKVREVISVQRLSVLGNY
jgi:hypothetical protein